jgi:hypothetical protein
MPCVALHKTAPSPWHNGWRMAAFGGRAREQAERVLSYAAATGTAALVDLNTGESALSIGELIDPDSKRRAAQQLQDAHENVVAMGQTQIVGRVGVGFALIVRLDSGVPASAVCSDRVAKACVLLSRMLQPTAAPPGGSDSDPSGGSGAPAEAYAMPPRRQ